MPRAARLVLASLSLFVAPRLTAQQPPSAASPLAAVAAAPGDVKSADAILNALYDANSMLVDRKTGADRLRSLFAPNARLITTVHGPAGATMVTRSADEYVALASRGSPRGGFSERETARTSEAFGSIMQVFSTYETHRNANDTQPVRGINSIQLFNDGSRWWVVTVFWDTERPGSPIPERYLKSGRNPP